MAPNNINNRKNNKKNRNKNKNKKASAAAGGGGTGGNNNHNNNPIPTEVTATTMPLTTEKINQLDTAFQLSIEKFQLKGYPKSMYFAVGMNHFYTHQKDFAMAAFQRGAKNGCVGCMYFLVYLHHKSNNVHLLLPLALEGAIRGHILSMNMLICECYMKSKPGIAAALISFWVKMMIEFGDNTNNEENRKGAKKHIANMCYVCGKEDSKEKAFEKCGVCKYYSYCGKDCQTYHWKEENHMAECRQLEILREYCKPRYVKEIRDAIIGGVDPKTINRLQLLRTNLGLNRPKEEYEELLLHLGDDSSIQDRYNYLTARKDGTVHIGSTPEEI